MNSLDKLLKWYNAHCNGDWEHFYGISLDTLDNPGFSLKIDLGGTFLSGLSYSQSLDNGDLNWLSINTEDNKIVIACSTTNLSKSLEMFFNDFLVPNIDETFLYDVYFAKITGVNSYIKGKASMTENLDFKVVQILEKDSEMDIRIGDVAKALHVMGSGGEMMRILQKIPAH